MSDKELNAYRFISGKEPSDEMLRHIMSEVTRDAVIRQKEAMRKRDEEVETQRMNLKAKWSGRINAISNG